MAEAEIAIVRSGVILDRPALEAAPRLRLILRAGTGTDTIDVEYSRERGVTVMLVPLSADSVAEHAFGLLLALSRRIPWFHRSLTEGRWEKHGGYGRELSGKSLGLLGFGRIGRRIAEIAQAFRMPLLAYDRSPQKAVKQEAARRLGVRFVELETMFAEADVVSVQIPAGSQSRGMIANRLIALMKPRAVIINVGRGGIIDEESLYAALRDGQIAGAALDVFDREPPRGCPLLSLDNFIGTPHVGAQTWEAQARVGASVVAIVEAFVAGRDLRALELGVVL
jgi:D-3-phosphoglycerate dehydrogenase